MIGWTLFLLTFLFYVKPAYWGGRSIYAAVKRDYASMNLYKDKFFNWFTGMWAFVKWQKDDI